MATRDQILEAVRGIGRPCTREAIRKWLMAHQPGTDWSDHEDVIASLCVNDEHYIRDVDRAKNALIKIGVRGDRKVWYWLVNARTGDPIEYESDTDNSWVQDVAGRLDPNAKYWSVLRAVKAIGRPCHIAEIEAWIAANEPKDKYVSARQDATMLTVNEGLRTQFDAGRRDYRSDRGHPKDVLYRNGVGPRAVTFELYDIAKHGIWDLRPNGSGRWQEFEVQLPPAERALAEAVAEVFAQPPPKFDSETTARRFAMQAVALREGQPRFRAELLEAYGSRCAITGCQVIAILEAVHIQPYAFGGVSTNRTDNGLLLRADLHTLFDKGLIWVDSHYRLHIAPVLEGSEYAEFEGRKLHLPEESAHHPHPTFLALHRINTAGQSG